MLVRAPAQVVQSLYIATDTSWTPSINYGSNGSSGFLYPVFQAAYHGNGELDAADYGHWTSSPYTLSGDDHSAIAYTIPLILDDGTVYGVLGVEILESYLQALLPGTELQNDSSGTYLLGVASNSAIGKDDLTVSVISASPLQMRRSNPMTRRCCSSRQSAAATRATPPRPLSRRRGTADALQPQRAVFQ